MTRRRRPTFAQYERQAKKIEQDIENSWSNKTRRGVKRAGRGVRRVGRTARDVVNTPLEMAFRKRRR